jgi:hypothetical protein
MQKPNRQAFPLRRWQSRQPRKTDPHYSARGVLKPHIAQYIAECYQKNEAPELFLTAWADPANGVVTFGLAGPYEHTTREQMATLDDLYE